MLAFKLGTLLIKQITKPVANELKRAAQKDGIVRELCSRYGQLHHRIESRLALRLVGHSSKRIKDVPIDAAIQTGANVLSEVMVFSVAAGLLIVETKRKDKIDQASKAEKQRKEQEQINEFNRRFDLIEQSLQRLQQQLSEQQQTVNIKNTNENDSKKIGWFHFS